MNFDEKDIEFFEKFNGFENKIYDEILYHFKSLHDKINSLEKHPKINKKNLELTKQDMEDFVNPNRMYDRLGVDILAIAIAGNLIPIADPDKGGNLLPETMILRQNLTDTYGYIIPSVCMYDSLTLEEYNFEIWVRCKKVYSGKLTEDDLKQNNPREIIKSLYKVCFDYAHYIITKTDVQKLMELIRADNPTLVNDIIPAYLNPIDLKHIFANLIQRRVGIKDITLVFEILNEYGRQTQDVSELTDIIEKELSLPINY